MAEKKNLRLNCVSVGTEAVFHGIIGLFSVCCIIPFLFVIIISFSSKESITTIGYSFMPIGWSVDAYQYAFNKLPQIWRSYFNSIYITGIGTVLSTTMCAMYAYVLYRPDFKFRGFFNFLSFFTMIFGGGLVPTYIVSKQLLGLSENYAALIVPLLVSPFNIIVMRSFFKSSVPLELIEAATIDGSGEYSTLFRVVVPIAKPGIATIALFNVVSRWNDWFTGMLYIKKASLIPLQTMLKNIQDNIDFLKQNAEVAGTPDGIAFLNSLPDQNLRMACTIIVIVPILCAYPFFQRYFVQGLTMGSVKE